MMKKAALVFQNAVPPFPVPAIQNTGRNDVLNGEPGFIEKEQAEGVALVESKLSGRV